jgi:hypothetical protein
MQMFFNLVTCGLHVPNFLPFCLYCVSSIYFGMCGLCRMGHEAQLQYHWYSVQAIRLR